MIYLLRTEIRIILRPPGIENGRRRRKCCISMANIREIAERAQVAPGTVSRALNNKGYISKETRKKIDKALKELEYVPNELARNLYRNRSNMIDRKSVV